MKVESRKRPRRVRTTLLQLVEAVRDAASNEREVLATLVDWIEHGAPRSFAPVPIAALPGRRRVASRGR